jgi:hypothetical protein
VSHHGRSHLQNVNRLGGRYGTSRVEQPRAKTTRDGIGQCVLGVDRRGTFAWVRVSTRMLARAEGWTADILIVCTEDRGMLGCFFDNRHMVVIPLVRCSV